MVTTKKMKNHCSECNKDQIYCKHLCHACYSRRRRSTPEGKAEMKRYNDTKGKEASKKYRDSPKGKEWYRKYRGSKPPKPPKLDCKCGEKSIAKGLCRKCYQRSRYRPGIDERRRERHLPILYDEVYIKILTAVINGATISQACERLKIGREKLYYGMTEKQKAELRSFKAIHRGKNVKKTYLDDSNSEFIQ